MSSTATAKKPRMAKDRESVNLRLDREFSKLLHDAAEAEDRSVTAMVRVLVREALSARAQSRSQAV